MGPAQAPLPCSTGGPVANSALLAVFPHKWALAAPGDGRKTNEIRLKPAAAERGSRSRPFECTKPNDLCLYRPCTFYGHRRTMSGTWLRSQGLELTNKGGASAAVACFASTTRSKSSIRFNRSLRADAELGLQKPHLRHSAFSAPC